MAARQLPLVEAQIREVRDDLPPGYYRQLPKLADGPFAGYPRVFSIAWAFVAHTDSHFDPETLRRYIVAYQSVQPLTIGELWAVPITLRIVLIENLRRLADQITAAHAARSEADALADVQLADPGPEAAMPPGLSGRDGTLSDAFAAQLAKRLRGRDPQATPALRLAGSAARGAGLVDRSGGAARAGAAGRLERHGPQRHHRHAPDLGRRLGGLRRERQPRRRPAASGSDFAAMDFPSRNLYRTAIEELARGSGMDEIEIADHAIEAARSAAAGPDGDRASDPGWHLIGGGRTRLERPSGSAPPAAFACGGWSTARNRRLRGRDPAGDGDTRRLALWACGCPGSQSGCWRSGRWRIPPGERRSPRPSSTG
jgi:cyclic beta-1,2-glucan synthetase